MRVAQLWRVTARSVSASTSKCSRSGRSAAGIPWPVVDDGGPSGPW